MLGCSGTALWSVPMTYYLILHSASIKGKMLLMLKFPSPSLREQTCAACIISLCEGWLGVAFAAHVTACWLS